MSAAREGWTERILSVSSPFRRTQKPDTQLGIRFFAFVRKKLKKLNRYFSMTSPFRCGEVPGNDVSEDTAAARISKGYPGRYAYADKTNYLSEQKVTDGAGDTVNQLCGEFFCRDIVNI